MFKGLHLCRPRTGEHREKGCFHALCCIHYFRDVDSAFSLFVFITLVGFHLRGSAGPPFLRLFQ